MCRLVLKYELGQKLVSFPWKLNTVFENAFVNPVSKVLGGKTEARNEFTVFLRGHLHIVSNWKLGTSKGIVPVELVFQDFNCGYIIESSHVNRSNDTDFVIDEFFHVGIVFENGKF
jgi:hypothetical protein